jgi:hypothetical protein
MKRIRLLSIPDPSVDRVAAPIQWEAARLDYANSIRQVIRQPANPQAGADLDEIRAGMRVFDALDRVGDDHILALEDADWEHLKSKTNAMRWGLVDGRILTFANAILEATEEPIDEDGLIRGGSGATPSGMVDHSHAF